MEKPEVLAKIKGGLIVSCQALSDEPLHDSYIMAKMALAAQKGGACGIRANTVKDIAAIRKEVDLPIIGIIKKIYVDSEIFITPTVHEVDELSQAGADIIAMDATNRPRPNGVTTTAFFREVRINYPAGVFMADCSTYDEGIAAADMGFDIIGTTLSGHTSLTLGRTLPDMDFIRQLVRDAGKPVIAEGGIWTPEQLKEVMDAGVFAAVVGTAITRPMLITKRFVSVLNES